MKHVLIICGGRSPEHEVTLRSACYVAEQLNPPAYILGIDRENCGYALSLEDLKSNTCIHASMGAPQAYLRRYDGRVEFCVENREPVTVDVVFPMIHGATGEDGCLQGFLKFLGVPCAGPDVVGSALCMQKRLTKQVLMANSLPVVPFVFFQNLEDVPSYEAVSLQLKATQLFVKPANSGSSAGISKVESASEFSRAVHEAFRYDDEILIERSIIGKEIECAILNGVAAQIVGEIEPTHSFYSYEAKYIDPNGANIYIPARITLEQAERVRSLAMQVAKILKCPAMARVDFFLEQEGTLWVNEVNTLPGFTSISLYPKLWGMSGLPGTKLVQELLISAKSYYLKSSACLTAAPI